MAEADQPPFDGVALSGGGVKGIGQLGVLHYYLEKGLLDLSKVKYYAGTSAGSIIGLLLACGYEPMDILQIVYQKDNLLGMALRTAQLLSVFTNFGLMSFQPIIDLVEKMVVDKLGFSPTLSELKEKTGKFFAITAVNVHKMRLEYFTPETKPNLKAISAVKLSCNLPLLCQRLMYNNDYFIDGGLGDNFPYEIIERRCKRILGVVVTGIVNNDSDQGKEMNFVNYLYKITAFPINIMTHLRCRYLGDNITMVRFNYDGISMMDFSLDRKKKMDMFMKGYQEAEKECSREKLVVEGWSWDGGGTGWGSFELD
jgi:predicted acylesterase/phospholipase RssA